MLFGCFMMVFGNVGMGSLMYVPGDKWIIFYSLAFVCRQILGYATGLIQVACLSVINKEYPLKRN